MLKSFAVSKANYLGSSHAAGKLLSPINEHETNISKEERRERVDAFDNIHWSNNPNTITCFSLKLNNVSLKVKNQY